MGIFSLLQQAETLQHVLHQTTVKAAYNYRDRGVVPCCLAFFLIYNFMVLFNTVLLLLTAL